MLVSDLIDILKSMPQDYVVKVNDNRGGKIFAIDNIDCFTPEDMDPSYPDVVPCVVIQVNVH